MTTLDFQTTIQAPREKVWEALWQDANYRRWTAVFHEGSYAESDWQEGSKIRFLTPTGEGMYGIIRKKVDGETMEFEHHGEVAGGEEVPKDWGGSAECYYLRDGDESGATVLDVKLDTNEDFREYFDQTFPKALDVVKQIAES